MHLIKLLVLVESAMNILYSAFAVLHLTASKTRIWMRLVCHCRIGLLLLFLFYSFVSASEHPNMTENSEGVGSVRMDNPGVGGKCANFSHKFRRDEICGILLRASSSLGENMQSIIRNYSSSLDAHSSTCEDVLSAVFDLILDTPNYGKQVALIDSILDSSPYVFHALLFHFTVANFKGIPTDRKDKFYYLIKRTFNRMSLEYILEIKDWEVAGYIWSVAQEKSMFEDWDEHRFIKYVVGCKPFILESIKIKLSRNIVKEYLDNPMSSHNREALYRLSE